MLSQIIQLVISLTNLKRTQALDFRFFYSSNPSLATVVDDYLYLQGAGEVTITAYQEGDRRYLPAEKFPIFLN